MFRRTLIVPILSAVALASSFITSAQQILTPAQAKGNKILLVVGEPEKGETNDDGLVKKYFENQGYVVTMAKEDDPATKATGQDLVVLSSTADPREIRDKYADVACAGFHLEHRRLSGHEDDGTGAARGLRDDRPGAGFRAFILDALRLLPQRHRSNR